MKFNLDIENINYIKIIYTDRNDTEHCIKAAIKRIDSREIFVSAKYEENLNIPYPQYVSVSFICENGIYKTKTTLKYIEFQEPHIYFALCKPAEVDYNQNREYFRIKLEEDIIISTESKTYNAKVYDLSASGVKVKLEEDIQFPPIVNVELLFTPKNVKAVAEYIRTDFEDGIYKAAFKFENLSESNMDIISQKCIQKQLEYRRNALKN